MTDVLEAHGAPDRQANGGHMKRIHLHLAADASCDLKRHETWALGRYIFFHNGLARQTSVDSTHLFGKSFGVRLRT